MKLVSVKVEGGVSTLTYAASDGRALKIIIQGYDDVCDVTKDLQSIVDAI